MMFIRCTLNLWDFWDFPCSPDPLKEVSCFSRISSRLGPCNLKRHHGPDLRRPCGTRIARVLDVCLPSTGGFHSSTSIPGFQQRQDLAVSQGSSLGSTYSRAVDEGAAPTDIHHQNVFRRLGMLKPTMATTGQGQVHFPLGGRWFATPSTKQNGSSRGRKGWSVPLFGRFLVSEDHIYTYPARPQPLKSSNFRDWKSGIVNLRGGPPQPQTSLPHFKNTKKFESSVLASQVYKPI